MNGFSICSPWWTPGCFRRCAAPCSGRSKTGRFRSRSPPRDEPRVAVTVVPIERPGLPRLLSVTFTPRAIRRRRRARDAGGRSDAAVERRRRSKRRRRSTTLRSSRVGARAGDRRDRRRRCAAPVDRGPASVERGARGLPRGARDDERRAAADERASAARQRRARSEGTRAQDAVGRRRQPARRHATWRRSCSIARGGSGGSRPPCAS